MVGGIVIEIFESEDERNIVWVNVKEPSSKQTCAIYIEKNDAFNVKIGDKIWWQGKYALWTPQENFTMNNPVVGKDCDIRLNRMSYSGVFKPKE